MYASGYFDIEFIKQVLPNSKIIQGTLNKEVAFCVDSRSLNSGDVFIALKGELTDGHNFLEAALKKGASGLVIEHNKIDLLEKISNKLLKDKFILALDNVLESIVVLATEWRKQFDIPVVGITGSVGKTSTKELIARILNVSGKKVYATKGNQNTLIGISLNMLQLNNTYDVAIFEMGINKRGEMKKLADLVNATYGVVTVIGHAHMSGLGSIGDIANEKRQIFKNFKAENIGVINGDQSLLSTISYKHPILKFGLKMTNQIQARKVEVFEDSINFILKIYDKKYPVNINTTNKSHVMNVLAASAIAVLLGVKEDIIAKSVQQPVVMKGRFDLISLKNTMGYVIDDCYNANPESMKSAILAFERLVCTGKKIIVIGDMNELGSESIFWHRQIGRFLRKAGSINHVILVGTHVKHISKTMPIYLNHDIVSSWQEALPILNNLLEKDSLVLVKGSTGAYKTGVVNLVKALTEEDMTEIPLNNLKEIKEHIA